MSTRVVIWNDLSPEARRQALTRPALEQSQELARGVGETLKQVKLGGDAALRSLTEKFDRVALESLQVTPDEIREAHSQVGIAARHAIAEAIRRVEVFHQAQLPKPIDLEISRGIRCERRYLPIPRVGLYIPGGSAPLPSTVVMLGVPSRIAGCELRVMATPPRRDGTIESHILVAADLLGIERIYKVGGAQAIAALAYGTETVPKVDKIFGPGNSWVTEAKAQVAQEAGGAASDLPAGPSEVMVIADSQADPAFIAADLLSQAEHGTDSQVVLATDSPDLIEKVRGELARQLARLPRREIAEASLGKSLIILTSAAGGMREAIEIANLYAPEHLIIQAEDARGLADQVKNAGSIFIGAWSPESVGDYASGTNHVLPTYGFARAYGGVTVESFMKSMTFQELTSDGLLELGPIVETLASVEGLDAHKNAVTLRLKRIRGEA